MYREWRANPQSVHVSWRTYFRNMEDRSRPASESFQPPPGIVSPNQGFQTPTTTQASQSQHLKLENKRASVQSLIHAYQNNGHKHARLDPLEMQPVPDIKDTPELTAEFYDLANEDLNQEYDLGSDLLPGFATTSRKSMALGDIIAACHQLYCSTYAVELQHVVDRTKREWLLSRLEIPQPIRFRRAEKGRILDDLIYSATLESLLALKYPNEKRFGLDGAESIGPAVAALIDRSADFHGVEEVVIGSCHRGRLTMSSSIYGKPYEAIFAEFAGQSSSKLLPGMTHDVRSHLGHDGERLTPDKRKVSLSLLSNPSHLEAVDPIATGKTFAAQRRWGEGAQEKVMCLALHGDAAFSGQGVVYETVNLSRLKAYGVGGTVRLMVNNQVGFTTSPSDSRSSRYCSDLMKYLDAPVFHVNADDVEATTFLCQLAADWRATFHTDCVVDIVCYRKFGHQELDLPDLTQPRMYEKISTHQSSLDRYVDKLVAEGSFTLQEIKTRREQISDQLQKAYLDSKNYVPKAQNHPRAWQGLATPEENATQELPALTTAKDEATLASIAKKITQVPAGFKLHKSLQRVFSTRAKGFAAGSVDWTTAEALAFGSLCLEGHHVRITGQDVQRGTFAQRHAVVHDQTTGHPWTALDHLAPDQARFFVGNSPLSEYGVLGFEYGFSLADPTALVVWEAQFGDFANTAQVIIDNFIANAENKWMDRSGVVLSLPHGSDGQGPEHSSARPGRFLDLCNEAADRPPDDLARQHQDCNMQVVNITSPANYFHVLRRQIRRPYRKRKSRKRSGGAATDTSIHSIGRVLLQVTPPPPSDGVVVGRPHGLLCLPARSRRPRARTADRGVGRYLARHLLLGPGLRRTAQIPQGDGHQRRSNRSH